MGKINESIIKKIEASEFGKNSPKMVKAMQQIADQLDSVGGAIGDLKLSWHKDEDLNEGEYVPFLILCVVKADSLLEGEQVDVDLVTPEYDDCDDDEDNYYPHKTSEPDEEEEE